jgi:murein DD-endopeptidase MepM/ murein hydrolase activator NlpD
MDDNQESWRAELSPAMLSAISVAIVTLVFGILLLLVAYTPLLDLMPGYRTNAGRSREMLIRSIVRVDSLERKINDMLTYNENRILVVSGKTPVVHSVKNDSLERDKSFVAPSQADSMLRRKIENNENYRLNTSKSESDVQAQRNMVAPMSGLISERFNSDGLHGVKVSGAKGAQVSAVADGVVVMSEWAPEGGHSVVIQHKNGFISSYRNLSRKVVSKGTQVKSTQVIGSAGDSKDSDSSTLEFELWCDAKAVNPELYIIF